MSTLNNQIAYLTEARAPLMIRQALVPALAKDEILIENKAIAVNPVDSMISRSGFLVRKYPVILGLDSAGVVVSTGSEDSGFKPGDRVLAMTESVFSPLQDKGSFQKYSVARTVTASKLPQHISFVEGSTLPLGALTAAAALFHQDYLGFGLPEVPQAPSKDETVLVWGGASSVGANAIQLAVSAGYKVVATASQKNFDLVRALGATKVIDYRQESVVEATIAALSGTNFVGTFLAAANGESFAHASKITGSVEGIQHIVSAPVFPQGFEANVKFTWTNLNVADYSPEVRRVAEYIFGQYLPRSLEAGQLNVIPVPRVVGTGLETLQSALETMSAGVSAEKLVVEL